MPADIGMSKCKYIGIKIESLSMIDYPRDILTRKMARSTESRRERQASRVVNVERFYNIHMIKQQITKIPIQNT